MTVTVKFALDPLQILVVPAKTAAAGLEVIVAVTSNREVLSQLLTV